MGEERSGFGKFMRWAFDDQHFLRFMFFTGILILVILPIVACIAGAVLYVLTGSR